MPARLRMLNLGCGSVPRQSDETWEVLNHDLVALPRVDETWDLNDYPWPWGDESFDCVQAFDILEHLDEPIRPLEEIHRILKLKKPNGDPGMAVVKVPIAGSLNHQIDLTHRRGYTEFSFDLFDPETHFGKLEGFYSWARFWVWRIRHDPEVVPPSGTANLDELPVVEGRALPDWIQQRIRDRGLGVNLVFELAKLPADEQVRRLYDTRGTLRRRHRYAVGLNPPHATVDGG